ITRAKLASRSALWPHALPFRRRRSAWEQVPSGFNSSTSLSSSSGVSVVPVFEGPTGEVYFCASSPIKLDDACVPVLNALQVPFPSAVDDPVPAPSGTTGRASYRAHILLARPPPRRLTRTELSALSVLRARRTCLSVTPRPSPRRS